MLYTHIFSKLLHQFGSSMAIDEVTLEGCFQHSLVNLWF